MATLVNPFIRGLDANGDAASGALLYVFEAGTTTPVTTYSDSALTTAQAHPLVANAAGEFEQVFLAAGTYKIRVASSDAVTLYENDNVRMADRPDDPVLFDTIALLLASTDTYADGTLLLTVTEGARYTSLASGATNFSDSNAGGQKLMRGYEIYETVSEFLNSVEPSREEGAIWQSRNFRYSEAAAGATDHHIVNAVGVKFYTLPDESGFYSVGSAVLPGGNCSPYLTSLAASGSVSISFSDIATTDVLSEVTFSNPVRMRSDGACKIVPSFGLGGVKMFAFETDDVDIEGLIIDGTGETFTPATGNSYIFFGGDGVTKYKNHRYVGNKITAASFSDGNTGSSNLLVTHAIYVDNVDCLKIAGNHFDGVSGAAVFLRDNHHFTVNDNYIKDTAWYPVNLTENCMYFEIKNNAFRATLAQGVYWGGAINLVSDPGKVKNKTGLIEGNSFSGNYSYGAVIRIQSSDNITVRGNEFLPGIGVGTLGPNTLGFVRVATRGTSTSNKNEPSQNILIENNVMYGPSEGSQRWGVYCTNEFQTARNVSKGLRVLRNKIISTGASDYFECGAIFHGLDGGLEDIEVSENEILAFTRSGSAVGGAVGFAANSATAKIRNVKIGGNIIGDGSTPASSVNAGIFINANVDEVFQGQANYLNNFFHAVRTVSGSGPTLVGLDNQNYGTNTADEVFSVSLSQYSFPLLGSKTYDPPSLAVGGYAFTDVTVTGATIGDVALAAFSLTQAGVILTPYVAATNTVRVYLENKAGGTIDLASGTISVVVMRQP